MSKFSGKCDFYDSFIAIHGDGDEEKIMDNLKRLSLYVYGNDSRAHLVKSDTIKDIAKYYPYLEGMAYYNKGEGYKIYLASEPFIDSEEREFLEWKIRDVLKYYRKCKKEKRVFDVDECYEKLNYTKSANENLKEIIRRVAENGEKAEFNDIHDSMHEYFRRRWFDELVSVGYTEREAYDWAFNAFFDDEETIERRLGRKLKEG